MHRLRKLFINEPVNHFSGRERNKSGSGFYFRDIKYIHHSSLSLNESAFMRLSENQKYVLLALITLVIAGFIINWQLSLTILLSVLTFIYFSDLLFNLFLIYKGYSKSPEINIKPADIAAYNGSWPAYTILCPLYKEAQIIPQFVESISKMDYPADRLQVMLLLERDDREAIEKIKSMVLPEYFETVIVPPSNPKTKPKACNYGLLKARGEYVVIYDAEDIPDPLQLKKAVLAFDGSDSRVVCIQAKLNFYNPRQNFLTRLFTAEYSVWFDLVLTGLQSINAPIPLGGTSNHFRTDSLRNVGGWDSFNVTEDCDLGMRLVKRNYRTAVLDSTTQEEANSQLINWFRQRSRWIKGYIQTYLVHMRDPKSFYNHWSDPHVITFHFIVGGKIFLMFINPLMWFLTIMYFVLRPLIGTFIDSLFPQPVFYMSVISLVFGNFLYMYYYMIGCAKRHHDDLIKYVFLTPVYWLGMSIAAVMALYELIWNPHYWSKTNHGLHLTTKNAGFLTKLNKFGQLLNFKLKFRHAA